MAAGAAEYVGEDRFLGAILDAIDPRLQGDEAVLVLVQRGVDRPGLGDELVQFEGQQGVALAAVLQTLIGQADPLEQGFEVSCDKYFRRLGPMKAAIVAKR
jgi:hypothetical protein